MMRERIRHLPVVRAGALIGMLSDRDVLARGTMGNDGILHVAPHAIVGDAMTPTPLVTCEASTDHPARELADGGKDRRRSSHGLRLVTSTDLLALLLDPGHGVPLPFDFRLVEDPRAYARMRRTARAQHAA